VATVPLKAQLLCNAEFGVSTSLSCVGNRFAAPVPTFIRPTTPKASLTQRWTLFIRRSSLSREWRSITTIRDPLQGKATAGRDDGTDLAAKARWSGHHGYGRTYASWSIVGSPITALGTDVKDEEGAGAQCYCITRTRSVLS
jgi:hypothetical protein